MRPAGRRHAPLFRGDVLVAAMALGEDVFDRSRSLRSLLVSRHPRQPQAYGFLDGGIVAGSLQDRLVARAHRLELRHCAIDWLIRIDRCISSTALIFGRQVGRKVLHRLA